MFTEGGGEGGGVILVRYLPITFSSHLPSLVSAQDVSVLDHCCLRYFTMFWSTSVTLKGFSYLHKIRSFIPLTLSFLEKLFNTDNRTNLLRSSLLLSDIDVTSSIGLHLLQNTSSKNGQDWNERKQQQNKKMLYLSWYRFWKFWLSRPKTSWVYLSWLSRLKVLLVSSLCIFLIPQRLNPTSIA